MGFAGQRRRQKVAALERIDDRPRSRRQLDQILAREIGKGVGAEFMAPP
jgi:hypothetical protein